MNSESKTPTPWEWAYDADPMIQCWRIAPGVALFDGTDGTPGGDEIDRANAEFIVLAVNSHDEMLAALRDCAQMLATLASFQPDTDVRKEMIEQRDAARAAISRAESKAS